jgi:hypothetical protein
VYSKPADLMRLTDSLSVRPRLASLIYLLKTIHTAKVPVLPIHNRNPARLRYQFLRLIRHNAYTIIISNTIQITRHPKLILSLQHPLIISLIATSRMIMESRIISSLYSTLSTYYNRYTMSCQIISHKVNAVR